MKKFFIKPIITALVLVMLAAMAVGCTNGNEQSSATAETAATQAETTAPQKTEFSLNALHAPQENTGDPFAGYWRIAEGAGSNLESFIYLFNGDGMASIIIGNMGYCGEYTVGTDEETGNETLKCQLMFGINGEYSYAAAEDGNKITITNNGEDSVLERVENPDFVTKAPENPQIDEKLVGAWDSGTGLYYYFGEDGRMYCNSYGTTFTYFTYSAKQSEVTAVYDMGGEQTDTYDYFFDGNDLVLDGMKYTQISPEKMMTVIKAY
ncbi:MAG: hypothetical protein ACI4HK_03290 [Ruminococcus sp.]